MRALLLSLCILSLTACEMALAPLPAWQSPEKRNHPDVGQIIELRSGARLSASQLLERLQSARWLLVGEQHDNPDHHALQVWLLEALKQKRPQGSLLLEMLTPSQEGRVREVQLAFAKGVPPDNLPAALGWQKGWDWAQYGPLMSYALKQSYALLPANLDRQEMLAIHQKPPLLVGAQSSAATVQTALSAQIREGHCNLLPDAQLPAMLAVQQQRDRRMAERLQAAPQPALLLAGAYHVRRDLGVPLHLADLGKTEGVVVLMLAEVGSQLRATEADFVWFTPAQPEQDHCARLRQPSR